MNVELTGLAIAGELLEFRRLRAAEGYFELGMYEEADAELEQINVRSRNLTWLLALKLRSYAAEANWTLMGTVAEKLTDNDPADVQWPIWWAYAAAKDQSVQDAQNILCRALTQHPNDPRLHYAMGCCESRLHHFSTARRHLARAIQLDSRFKLVALNDEELQPLWRAIEQFDS